MDFKPFNYSESSKIKKVENLFLRATTDGEREAARRILVKLKQKYAPIQKYEQMNIQKYEFKVFQKI